MSPLSRACAWQRGHDFDVRQRQHRGRVRGLVFGSVVFILSIEKFRLAVKFLFDYLRIISGTVTGS